MTRIALACPYGLDVPGGVQTQILGIAKSLGALGHSVVVFAPGAKARRDQGDPGVRFVDLGRTVGVPVNGSRAPVAINLAALRVVHEGLSSFGSEVVFAHEPVVPGPTLAAVFGQRLPVIGTFHRSGAGTLYRLLRPYVRAVLSRLDEVVAVSQSARDTLISVSGDPVVRCRVMENGVDYARFSTASPCTANGFTIVFTGRHERRKGLEVLLQAFRSLSVPAQLWVIGKGPMTAELMARYGNDKKIEWCGAVDDDELARRVKGADLAVAPALYGESFGLILVEAMAAGTAVVASDLPGFKEAAAGAAEFFKAGDVAGLAKLIERLAKDPLRRAELVSAGKTRAKELAFSSLAERYVAGYESLSRAR